MSHRRSRIASAIFACVLMLVISLGLTAPALAREYEMVETAIDASVLSDGSMDVREERTFSFDGSFNGVYWNLPQGDHQGREVTVDVLAAGEIVNGEVVAYELSDSGDNLTYSIESYGSSLRLKIYARHANEDARFFIEYRLNNVALRHADVSELYWQFVTRDWDEESQNVTCTVHLPVPSGQSVVPEDNVRAWGHGPLDASLAFEGDDIVYTVPGVGSSEFAEARITFPESWLSDAEQDSESVLDAILAEEQREADKANRQRFYARTLYYGSMIVAAVASVGTAILAFFKRMAYKRALTPQFDDRYFRDVPTRDHPAVLGLLYHRGYIKPELFTATLMELTNNGDIALQHARIEHGGLFGSRTEDDYRLVANRVPADSEPDAAGEERASARINRKAFDLMFEKVALGTSDEPHKPGAYPPMYFSRIATYAKEDSTSYKRAYDSWESAVRAGYTSRFASGGTVVAAPTSLLVGLGVFTLFLGVAFFFAGFAFGMPGALHFAFTAMLAAAGIYAISCGLLTDTANAEGREVRAQLKALRNWLADFTRLNEAIPTDVVLWNRLLVMAVVLGVADEVVRQLETVLPEVLHDEHLTSTYGWYYVSTSNAGSFSPAQAISTAVSAAHTVSTASEASSTWSSGGGGGGGFSGGGGGGFGGGGGGGGGAF